MTRALIAILTLLTSLAAHGAQQWLGNTGLTNDTPRVAYGKINTNFAEVYLALSNGVQQLGTSNSGVKPLIAPGQTNKVFSLQAGPNILLSMSSTSVIASLASDVTVTGQLDQQGQAFFETDLFALGAFNAEGAAEFGGPVTAQNLNSVIYVPAAGHLTNVFKALSNNMRIVITETQVVQVFPTSIGAPHLLMTNKTNIVIEGLGWGSVVQSYQTGTVFAVSNCYGITFRNFANVGTRGPNSGATFPSQFCAFDISNSRFLHFAKVFTKNHSDQGICFDMDPVSSSSDVLIEDCPFENIGTTNATFTQEGLAWDGTAIVPDGRNWLIRGCTFTNNFRDIEPFSLVGTDYAGLKIVNNQFVNTRKESFFSQQTLLVDMLYEGNTVIGNPANQVFPVGQHYGLYINGGHRGRIVNNTFKFLDTGIYLVAENGAPMDGWTVANNTVFACIYPLLVFPHAATSRGFTLQGNLFHNNWEGIQIGGQYHQVVDNQFIHNCTNSSLFISLWYLNAGGPGGSNRLARNVFYSDGSGGATAPQYAIVTQDGTAIVDNNRIYGDFSVAPWNDTAGGNQYLNNFVGTNLIAYVARTNSYSGTNVIWNVASNPRQVLVATNEGLIIVTNYAQLDVSQDAELLIVNNKATNMALWWTAGPRWFGPGSSNAVASGKVTMVQGRKTGTNFCLMAWPQTN